MFRRRGEQTPPEKLPQLHAFIDVVVGGRSAEHVVVESVDARGILVAGTVGRPGETAIAVYTTPVGRFKAKTRIAAAEGANTLLALPRDVTTIGAASGEQKRQSVRMDALVTGSWRFAPGDKGTGEFVKCSIRDISRGGCSVILDRELKFGTKIEVRLNLSTSAQPLTLLAEVMRHQVIPQSGKHSHGVRFQGLRTAEDQAIVDFINRRQSDLRNRGLA